MVVAFVTHNLKCQTLFQHLRQSLYKNICLYQYNAVFLFNHVWFYIITPKPTYYSFTQSLYWLTWINRLFMYVLVFLISIAIKSYVKNLYDKLFRTPNSFFSFSVVTSFISLSFLTFSIVLQKTELFMNLKKYFSKSFFTSFLSLVFISIYGFSQPFWLNLITLCTFF